MRRSLAVAALLAAAALAVAAGLSGCGQSLADQLAKARALIARNDRDGAVLQLKSVLQVDPESAEARFLLGQQLLAAGDALAAVVELRRALERDPTPDRVAPTLARALLQSGQPRQLLAQFAGLELVDRPAVADLQSSVAQAQATLGDLAAARASLQRALQAMPDFEPALLLQARVAAVGGDLAGALRLIGDLLARDPKSADGWLLQGDLLARQQAEPARLLQAYRQALALRPDHPGAHAALLTLHLAQRDLAAAAAQLAAMQQALPRHPQTLLFDGQLALLQGELPRARELFQRLLRAAPDNLALLRSAGAVELRLGAPAQAEVLLAKALLAEAGSAPTRRLLAQAQLAQGQPARALATLEPLLGAAGADAEALALAAQARLVAGDGAAAAALFERAARLKPDDARIRTALALSHLAHGQGDAAVAELQAVAASDPGSTADLALISALLQRKSWDAALAAVDALERKQPALPLAPHLRGQVLLRKADPAGARAAFTQAVERDARYYPPVAALAGLDLQDGQPEAARARLQAVLQADPRNGAARLALAELAARGGATREAVAALLDEAVKASPADLSLRLALIDHHLGSANPRAALLAAQAALVQTPDQVELLARLGRSQLAAGEHQQAGITYSRLAVLQPKSVLGLLGQAEAQIGAQDLAAAARSLRRALELVPDALPVQRLAVTVALRQQQPAQALALARQVQQQRPTQAVGYLIEGEIEIGQQRWDAAAAVLRKALAQAEPGQSAERLHHALASGGRAAEAQAFAAAWRKEHPRDALFPFYLGDLAVARRDLAGAEQHYRAVLELLPEHALALNNIAWLLLEQRKPGALAYAERANAAAPNQPALLDTLALCHAALQQPAKAIALAQRALALQPADAGLRLNLARFYAQSGEKRLAKAELDRIAALGERFARQAEVAALLSSLGGR